MTHAITFFQLCPIFIILTASAISSDLFTTTTPDLLLDNSAINASRTHRLSKFSRLNLEIEELLGSRWALEQTSAISVYHAVEIVDAVLIDKNHLTLGIEFYIRQRWIAEGIKFPKGLFLPDDPPGVFVSAKESALKHMWSPASYVATARESRSAISSAPIKVVHIFPNGTIIYKARLYTNVACSSNFSWYPLDTQECILKIESYKYLATFVNYQWENESLYRPITVKVKRLLQYHLSSTKSSNGSSVRGGRGARYPFVSVKFIFERKLGNNLIQVYTPTTLVVVLSWFSFWLGLDAVPGRISLLITSMLTLVTMHSGLKGSIPPVHYITMMDVWMVASMAFVFMAICEFIIVKYLHWRHELEIKQKMKCQVYLEEEDYLKFGRWLKFMQMSAGSQQTASWTTCNENGRQVNRRGDLSEEAPKITPHQPKVPNSANGVIGSARSNNVNSVKQRNGYLKDKESEMLGNRLFSVTQFSVDPEVQEDPEQKKKKAEKKLWVVIDNVCRGFFPFLFCSFNCIYWVVLYQGSGYQRKMSDAA